MSEELYDTAEMSSVAGGVGLIGRGKIVVCYSRVTSEGKD